MKVIIAFVGQYFKADCDITAVTMATLKVHGRELQFSVFANYLKSLVGDLPFLLHFLSCLNFLTSLAV